MVKATKVGGPNEGSCTLCGKQTKDTKDGGKGGNEGSRKWFALPQTGYRAPLRGILNFNASKTFHKKTTLFCPQCYVALYIGEYRWTSVRTDQRDVACA